jgi:glycosyltransferase involved in cell wall biosynthesis
MSFSVIITTHNNQAVLAATLKSAEEAIGFDADCTPSFRAGDAQIVVVDDGSTDGTPEILRDFVAGKAMYTLVRRQHSSSPACARNAGVEVAHGELLIFLDGDDLFLPPHIHHCLQALEDPKCCFAKTGVHLKDPVHPDWKQRIEHSVVINLCLRRRCHTPSVASPTTTCSSVAEMPSRRTPTSFTRSKTSSTTSWYVRSSPGSR